MLISESARMRKIVQLVFLLFWLLPPNCFFSQQQQLDFVSGSPNGQLQQGRSEIVQVGRHEEESSCKFSYLRTQTHFSSSSSHNSHPRDDDGLLNKPAHTSAEK
jgi:hypothetical protein